MLDLGGRELKVFIRLALDSYHHTHYLQQKKSSHQYAARAGLTCTGGTVRMCYKGLQ